MEKEKVQAVISFVDARGWGFCELSDGRAAFVHYSDVQDDRVLHTGDKIVCRVEVNNHPKNKLRAREIELIERGGVA